MGARPLKRSAAQWLFVVCGVWLVSLGFYFIFVRPPLLPEDVRYMGTHPEAVRAALPGLAAWLGKVFTVMGGFMTGAGVLVTYVALRVMPHQPPGTVGALVLVGALTVGLMSAVNFALGSDFRWLLLAPPVLWAAAVLTLLGGRATG